MAHKSLQCTGFPARYSAVNKLTSIATNRMELALSLIALGPCHRPHQLTGAFWWSLRGVVTMFSLLDAQLKPTHGFKSQTASNQKADAFKLAEALTRWFAQRHLGAAVVVPVEQHAGTFTRMSSSAPYPKSMPKYFRHSTKPAAKTEPDFFAFRGPDDIHVLESKGRAGFAMYGVPQSVINAARNKALRQVCAIQTLNGIAPKTRSACVFAFDQAGLQGQVTDPPSTVQFNYEVAWPRLITRAYATVLDPLFEANRVDIDRDYVGVEFMPGWKFGIHKAVIKQLRDVDDEESFKRFLGLLSNLPASDGVTASKIEDRSYSPDGFVLIGTPDTFETPLRDIICM
ncbi:hypothetical protein NKK52_18300 [Mesorhizobium sp. C277A]|uniref:hypothetical protein n=1 Tax=Mesorhizobium sp. C277A TaxID=2956827 RepID=UPI0012EC1E5C|nr:hypothetical protein [Mesorhizobium sp. LSJC277A00]